MTRNDADELKEIIERAIIETTCEATEKDQFGQRFIVDFPVQRGENAAEVRTTWIILSNEDYPRLTSCYVK